MVRGIEDVAHDAGYRLVLCNSDGDVAKEAGYIDVAIGERMAGVVIAVASDERVRPRSAARPRHPGRGRRPSTEAARDDVDSVAGRQPRRRGGRRRPPPRHRRRSCGVHHRPPPGQHRRGAARRLPGGDERDGAAVEPALVRRADYKRGGRHAAPRASLLDRRRPPDALFVANNLMTLGALQAVDEAGLRVPEDVALVGFDDAPWTTLMRPQLTVVAQPALGDRPPSAPQLLAAAGPRDSAGDPRRCCRRSSSWPAERPACNRFLTA